MHPGQCKKNKSWGTPAKKKFHGKPKDKNIWLCKCMNKEVESIQMVLKCVANDFEMLCRVYDVEKLFNGFEMFLMISAAV